MKQKWDLIECYKTDKILMLKVYQRMSNNMYYCNRELHHAQRHSLISCF